jgi:uncharacterized protein (TIGR02058 family)
MGQKRYVVEFGTGADLHGGDVTQAAERAVKDAISRSCLCGLCDIFGMKDLNQMHVEVKIGCPRPDAVRQDEVAKMIPFGSVSMQVVDGGLSVKGLSAPALGEGDSITIAVAALTVYVNVED